MRPPLILTFSHKVRRKKEGCHPEGAARRIPIGGIPAREILSPGRSWSFPSA